MQMRMSFMVVEIWSFGFAKVMEIFLKEFERTLVFIFHSFCSSLFVFQLSFRADRGRRLLNKRWTGVEREAG